MKHTQPMAMRLKKPADYESYSAHGGTVTNMLHAEHEPCSALGHAIKKTSCRSYNCAFKIQLCNFDDSLITVNTTSPDQHKLYFCTIALTVCEI